MDGILKQLPDLQQLSLPAQILWRRLAVFAGNFSNHMYALAEKLLVKQGLSFDLLKPLIAETAAKALEIPPHLAQTGPAVRGDNTIMEEHMALLESYPEFAELYRLISMSIMNLKSDPNS